MQSIEPIANLAAQLARLPGVGMKTAQRLAYHLLDTPAEQAQALAAAITYAREHVFTCPVCGGYTDVSPCGICADNRRDAAQICVVQEARDILAIEKSREFFGKYHVLQGYLSPMDGIGPEDIRIQELLNRVDAGGVEEIILATNPDVEGEATASYLSQLLKEKQVRVTRLAHGIPIGGNLEYTDEVTLARAFEGRREV